MPTTIRIPAALRECAAGRGEIEIEGAGTVGEALDRLAAAHAPLRRHLYTDGGALRSYVNVYLNADDVRALAGERTPVRDGDAITIVPSIAGG